MAKNRRKFGPRVSKVSREELEKEPKFIELPDDYPTDDEFDEEWVKLDVNEATEVNGEDNRWKEKGKAATKDKKDAENGENKADNTVGKENLSQDKVKDRSRKDSTKEENGKISKNKKVEEKASTDSSKTDAKNKDGKQNSAKKNEKKEEVIGTKKLVEGNGVKNKESFEDKRETREEQIQLDKNQTSEQRKSEGEDKKSKESEENIKLPKETRKAQSPSVDTPKTSSIIKENEQKEALNKAETTTDSKRELDEFNTKATSNDEPKEEDKKSKGPSRGTEINRMPERNIKDDEEKIPTINDGKVSGNNKDTFYSFSNDKKGQEKADKNGTEKTVGSLNSSHEKSFNDQLKIGRKKEQVMKENSKDKKEDLQKRPSRGTEMERTLEKNAKSEEEKVLNNIKDQVSNKINDKCLSSSNNLKGPKKALETESEKMVDSTKAKETFTAQDKEERKESKSEKTQNSAPKKTIKETKAPEEMKEDLTSPKDNFGENTKKSQLHEQAGNHMAKETLKQSPKETLFTSENREKCENDSCNEKPKMEKNEDSSKDDKEALLKDKNLAQKKNKPKRVPKGDCVVCLASATFLCSGCQHVFYCGRKHQKEHWPTHKKECAQLKLKPYRVERNASLGRFLIAKRDLQPHEVIIEESPLVIGPRQLSLPVCLGCHKVLYENKHYEYCRRCGWPMCSRECSDSPLHVGECVILAAAPKKVRVSPSSFGRVNMMYASVAVLRVLALKSDSARWSAYTRFESHLEARMRTQVYTQINKEKVVFFIQHGLGLLSRFSDLEILEACAKLDTNCFEIRDDKTNLRAMYETSCIMSHDCMPNTKHVFEDSNIRVISTRSIERDEVISANYSHALWTTMNRREHLSISKCFMCKCQRCSDPSENGSFLAAIKCKNCGNDRVLPMDPLNTNSQWGCSKCNEKRNSDEVKEMVAQLTKELKSINTKDPTQLEYFLNTRLALNVSDSHQLCRELQYALVFLVSSEESTAKLLLRKLVHCTQLLELAKRIEPGYTRFRGQLLMQWVDINIELDQLASNEDPDIKKKTLESCVERLSESREILLVEADFDEERFELRRTHLQRRIEQLEETSIVNPNKSDDEDEEDIDDESEEEDDDEDSSDEEDEDSDDDDVPGLI